MGMKGKIGSRVESERFGKASRSVIETISCECVSVCTGRSNGLGQRLCSRNFTKHGHITETQ